MENYFFTSPEERKKLEEFSKKLQEKFPEIKLSADSFGRDSDRAIELNQLQDKNLLQKIQNFMNEENIFYLLSNVQLNFWKGSLSKAFAAKIVLKTYYQPLTLQDCLIFGDSLNDETLFKEFPHSVGVSNIEKVIKKLSYKPSTLLYGEKNREILGVFQYLKDLLA